MTSDDSIVVATCAAAAAFVLSAGLTEGIRRLAWRYGVVDHPAASRPHRRPTPYLGGVAIVVGTLIPAGALLPGFDVRIVVIMICAVLVALVGVIDDCRPLKPLVRLLPEAFAAAMVVAVGVRIEIFGNGLDVAITLCWVIFVTNSVNMIDNTDGVLPSIAIASTAVLAVTAFMSDKVSVAYLLMAVSFACLGFLAHNWHPARIFMGDAGSLFIGFVLAVGAVMVVDDTAPVTAVSGLLLFTFVPVLDTCLAFAARVWAGRPLLAASPHHIAHRCVAAGIGARHIALITCAAATVTSLLGMVVLHGWIPGAVALVAISCVGVTLVGLLLRAPGRYPSRPAPRAQHGHGLVGRKELI